MRERSSSSAGAIYLDREKRIEELRQAARRAAARVPAIHRVVLFGSLAAGIAGPRSDADLLIVVDGSAERQPRDRVPEMLRALSPLPCPVDLVVLTEQELEEQRSLDDPLVREILTHGQTLL